MPSISPCLHCSQTPAVQDITIPLGGNPNAFPDDNYTSQVRLTAVAPGLSLASARAVQFYAPSVVDGLEIGASFDGAGAPAAFQLSRPWYTTIAVFLTAILYPLLILGALLVISPRAPRREGPSREILLASAALALTFLPLRQVFVPPDITGITRLDWTLIIALFLVVLGAHVWDQPEALFQNIMRLRLAQAQRLTLLQLLRELPTGQ